jgi:hypothetical protein
MTPDQPDFAVAARHLEDRRGAFAAHDLPNDALTSIAGGRLSLCP